MLLTGEQLRGPLTWQVNPFVSWLIRAPQILS